MSTSEHQQVTTIVRRLGELLNPVALAGALREVVREVSTPPPGDAAALAALTEAYRRAATELRAVLPAAATTFTDAAAALTELATAVREQQRRHGELRLALRAAVHDATHVGNVPAPDPAALGDVVRVVTELRAVYTASLTAADRAASRFADLTGRARAAAAVRGGLAPEQAIAFAALRVSVPGIGDAYDDGVLTLAQLRAAGVHLAADRVVVGALLGGAGSDAERAWLLKALVAGHGVPEVSGFADTIRGRDPVWLSTHLSLIDRGGAGHQERLDVDIRQYEDTTCGTTSLIVARAEADPLYALALTTGDLAANFSAERARVHDETNVIWPEDLGTLPGGMAGYLNDHLGGSGVRYRWQAVDDTDPRRISAALREVLTAVDLGHPVPILVGGAVPRHYVLAVGHSGDTVLIYEPTRGATVPVPERDFLDGNLKRTAGFDHAQVVVLPVASYLGQPLAAGSERSRSK